MARDICVISTHRSLTEKIQRIIDERQEDIDVYTATLGEAACLCRKLADEGAKVFISRGGNARYLQKMLSNTVVNISHNLSDYLEALERAKNVGGRVGVFSYEQKLYDIDTVGKLMGIDIKQYIFSGLEEARYAVAEAQKDGMILGIGGIVTGRIAEELGIDYIVIDSSKTSIINAIESAKQLLQVQKEENRKAENYKIQMENYQAILDFSYSGIIAIDENCIITAFNPIAEKIIGIQAKKALGSNIRKVFAGTQLINVLKTGMPEHNQIMKINGRDIYTNRIPICIGGKVRGVVATFEDVKKIQEDEQEIRRKLHNKGLVAKYCFSDILGSSPEIKQAISIAKSYADRSSTVLIQGESGTGKELFAQSIHNLSNRRHKPFVAINCAALPKDLLESELFGYEDGTFTGARKGGKMGLFEVAHGGTIFLDEIAEIPLSLQAQLLRVLQEKEIRRLGSDNIIPVDVRIIAATNKNLEVEMKEKRFREDLFYRINVLKLDIPPLRERRGDIKEIGEYFLNKSYSGTYRNNTELWDNILDHLSLYPWYGNIRELENTLERLVVMTDRGIMDIGNFSRLISGMLDGTALPIKNDIQGQLDDKGRIYHVLMKNGWNRTAAAAELCISRSTLWRKMKRYGIGM